MKVLKHGRPQKGWSQKYTCTGNGNKGGGCGAELLVEWDDLFITTSYAYDESETHITFECSECGVLTDIPINDPPDFTLIPDKDVWIARQEFRRKSMYEGGPIDP